MIDSQSQNNEHKTVLVVDDEAMIRTICLNALVDYHVEQAGDGVEALAMLEENEFDIILTDVRMPNMDGLELLQKIKAQHPDQAVVLMTGYSDKATILEALKEGADDFINKPVHILQLSTTVDKVYEKQKIRRELANLKRIDKLKNDFLGIVSHKLKTPTTAISLFLQNLAEGVESPSDENFQQMVDLVQNETALLEQLIQDLLYFSEATLESENGTLEPIDLGKVAARVCATLNNKAHKRNLTLTCDIADVQGLPKLMLNSHKTTFIIRALLDNAIKFTPAEGTIKVTGTSDKSHVYLTISDNGVGIPTQEINKIFNRFYQVDPERTGQIPGFGLGLFYARDFIRSMNGKLQIESSTENGTRATIEFPLPH